MTYQVNIKAVSVKASKDRCGAAYARYQDALTKNTDNDPLAQDHLRKICKALNSYMRIQDSAQDQFPALVVAF